MLSWQLLTMFSCWPFDHLDFVVTISLNANSGGLSLLVCGFVHLGFCLSCLFLYFWLSGLGLVISNVSLV